MTVWPGADFRHYFHRLIQLQMLSFVAVNQQACKSDEHTPQQNLCCPVELLLSP